MAQGTYSASSFRRSNTMRAASMTSLPTPSPGIHAILYLGIVQFVPSCFSLDHRRNDEKPSSRNSDFGINLSFVIQASSFIWLLTEPGRHEIFGAAGDN